MAEQLSPQDAAKQAAADAAAAMIEDGMLVGLGSGTTLRRFVRSLGARCQAGLKVTGVPTSETTRALAIEVGVPVADLNDVGELDIVFDGADEIDPQGQMIKGGGGNLLWEKIVATAGKRFVAVIDGSKTKDQLGQFPLPVEVIRFGWHATERLIRELLIESGYLEPKIVLRGGLDTPFVTDSGHYILDCALGVITHPEALSVALNRIPGVVENGLFIDIARSAIIGEPDGALKTIDYPDRLAGS
ncbi:ribose-5-phosphate isomerase RpiA [Acidisoma silvae]|uniref:Ribose-5-phosphate isomerase A n=1 Tax=Acidisoma silvae TaxID=2802396 RepID=A0A963YQ65_9PROT|nr:ribose-5-phosphate isomerase RpiA [Acidisoma silvae]MCB8874662.1 ribose-5-phosphate isomerase RpiA [Acidisoma silvae]